MGALTAHGFYMSLFSVTILICIGCSSRADEQFKYEFMQFGLTYHFYKDAHGEAPGIDDMGESVLGFPVLSKQVDNGELVVVWNGRLVGNGDKNDEYVMAYQRHVAESGGWVLLGGGSVRKMTAEEFKKLPTLPFNSD